MPVARLAPPVPPARLLEQARVGGNPVIEDGRAWFVWSGPRPPLLNGDFFDWDIGKALRLQPAGENLWAAGLEFPCDAYIEYAFFDGKKRIPDPLNLRRSPNGLGKANQFFYMPEGRPTPLVLRRSGLKAGKTSQHRLDPGWLLPGPARTLLLYQPPVSEPCPLLLVYDGLDYHRRTNLVTQLENLVALGRIRPLALAMLQPYGPARMAEYICSDLTLAFLIQQVLPLAGQHLNLTDPTARPGAWGTLGASAGGLMALYTAVRLPEIFGQVLCQSGGFASLGARPVVFDLVEHMPPSPMRIWMDIGKYEELLPANQAMSALLHHKGCALKYQEYNSGHNYPSWRNHLHAGLEFLWPPSPNP